MASPGVERSTCRAGHGRALHPGGGQRIQPGCARRYRSGCWLSPVICRTVGVFAVPPPPSSRTGHNALGPGRATQTGWALVADRASIVPILSVADRARVRARYTTAPLMCRSRAAWATPAVLGAGQSHCLRMTPGRGSRHPLTSCALPLMLSFAMDASKGPKRLLLSTNRESNCRLG